jgi:transcriptional regulator
LPKAKLLVSLGPEEQEKIAAATERGTDQVKFIRDAIIDYIDHHKNEINKYNKLVSERTIRPIIGTADNLTLDEAKVRKIRKELLRGDRLEDIAQRHGTTKQNISLIKLGKVWRNVE